MKINQGDIIRFLNDTGGGTVKKIISDNMVLVQTEDDFEYTVPTNELVVIKSSVKSDESYENKETVKEPEPEITEDPKFIPELKDDNSVEIHLAFIKSKNKDVFECYLLNDSNHYLFFHAVIKLSGIYKKLDADKTEPNTMIKLGDFSRNRINNTSEIIVQIMFYGHKYDVIKEQHESKIKIEPVKFFTEGNFKPNDFFDENAYMFILYKDGTEPVQVANEDSKETPENIPEEKDIKDFFIKDDDKPKISKPHKKPETIEVDLHINHLLDSVVGLSNHEILQIQMEYFHKNITDAINKKADKIVFIHGIGNGTLKTALRESLSMQYNLHYEDASFKEYGFGATMVML